MFEPNLVLETSIGLLISRDYVWLFAKGFSRPCFSKVPSFAWTLRLHDLTASAAASWWYCYIPYSNNSNSNGNNNNTSNTDGSFFFPIILPCHELHFLMIALIAISLGGNLLVCIYTANEVLKIGIWHKINNKNINLFCILVLLLL